MTPPDISIFARPRARATASRMSAVDMLSSEDRCRRRAPSACVDLGERSAPRPRSAARADARARALDGRLHAAGEPDVVVLDQHRVEQPDAMIGRAAGAHGVFLEHAQRRRRLARVEDRDAAAGRVDELPRARRDARQPLQKIERRALGDEQRPRRARRLRPTLFAGARSGRRRVPRRNSGRDPAST